MEVRQTYNNPNPGPLEAAYVFPLPENSAVGDMRIDEADIMGKARSFVGALESKGQRARVFGYGIGSSVNRHLIEGLSRAGKGVAVIATSREDPRAAVQRFYRYIDHPVLTNVEVDFGGAGIRDLAPSHVPDLFASHPAIVHGRYTSPIGDDVRIIAQADGSELSIPVRVRPALAFGTGRAVLGRLWARAHIQRLEERLWDGGAAAVRRDITDLGLKFKLVTRYTSFVAVDDAKRVGDGDPELIWQLAEAPEGVDLAAAGGARFGMPSPLPEPRGDLPSTAPPSSEDHDRAESMTVEGFRACGCHVVGRRSNSIWLLALAFAAWLLRWRRTCSRGGSSQ